MERYESGHDYAHGSPALTSPHRPRPGPHVASGICASCAARSPAQTTITREHLNDALTKHRPKSASDSICACRHRICPHIRRSVVSLDTGSWG